MGTRKLHDLPVAVRSRGPLLAGALVFAAASGARTLAARACSFAEPAVVGRSVWPGGDTRPPVNTRIVVVYQVYSFSVSDIPPLGTDVQLQTASGQPVDASVQVLGNNVVVQPATLLAPNTQYQLADRRLVPCDVAAGECALLPEPQPFASFTTGSGTDTVAPSFSGLAAVHLDAQMSCNSDSCCGDYSAYPVEFEWTPGTDDTAGSDLRYNLYYANNGQASRTLSAALVPGPTVTKHLVCHDNSNLFAQSFASIGTYFARAVDWSGNEDKNTAAGTVPDACGCGCGLGRGSGDGGGGGAAGLWFAALIALAIRRRGGARERSALHFEQLRCSPKPSAFRDREVRS